MASVDIETFLLTRLGEFDPTLDISVGGPVHQQVVAPLLARLGVDPLSTDVRSFMLSRIRTEYPDLDIDTAGSAIDMLLLGPAQLVLEPFRQEIAWVRNGRSLSNPSLLTQDDAASLLANVFSDFQPGSRSSGTVRVYYPDKRTVTVDGTVTALSKTGKVFYASQAFILTADQMALQVEDGQYYVDVALEAAADGDDSSIGADEIASVSGMPGYTRVRNALPFQGGVAAETIAEAAQRTRDGLGERSPSTDAGVRATITEYMPEIRAMRAIGYGDPEMTRDVIRGTVTVDEAALGLGPVVMEGVGDTFPAVSLAVADATGAALTYLALPGRTNRMVDAAADFTDLSVGDSIYVKGADRGVADVVSATEVELDDFSVIAKGTTGQTLYDSAGPVLLMYSTRLQDMSVDFTAMGVSAGDWLRVRGGWAAGLAQPTGTDINAPGASYGPGNTSQSYFQITGVTQHYVACRRTSDEILRYGYHQSAGVPNGCNVINATGKVILNPASTVLFTDEPAVQSGDFISLYKLGTPTPVAPEEWEIDTVDNGRELTLVGGATPTDYQEVGSDAYQVKWAIRRSSVTKTGFLLANSYDNEWAIIRLRASINPDTYSWLVSSDTSLSYTARAALTLAGVGGSARLTISDVPVGVTFPVRLGEVIDVSATDEIHIGGCTDAYAYQPAPTAQTLQLTDLRDQDPLVEGTDLSCGGATDTLSAATMAAVEPRAGDVLVITSGEYRGSYRIIYSGGSGTIRIDTTLVNPFSAVSYYISRESSLSLDKPKILRETGSTLQTYFQSTTVLDTLADFVTAGVEVGDTLELLSGSTIGTRVITAVLSAIELAVSVPLPTNGSNISYQVYRALTPISRPFKRLTGIDVLSPEGTPSGTPIPYADPVDIRTSQLVNMGRGALISGEDMYVEGVVDGATVVISGNTNLTNRVGPGHILKIKNGANLGTYVIQDVVGASTSSRITLHSLPPLRESLPSMRVSLVYAGPSGAYAVGETLMDGATAIGTIEAHNTTTFTLTVLLTGTTPGVGTSVTSASQVSGKAITAIAADIEYEIGPASIGVARAYFLEPTLFEVRNEGRRDRDTALFVDEDGRQYAPAHQINHRYLEFDDTARDRWLVDSLMVLPYVVVSGSFVAGQTLEITSGGADIGTVLWVGSGVLWVRYTGPGAPVNGTAFQNTAATASGTASGAPAAYDNAFATVTGDLQESGVEAGDRFEALSVPIRGLADITTGESISGLTLSLKVAGVTRTMTFTGTNPIPYSQITPSYGIIQQINQQIAGVEAIAVSSSGSYYLELHSTDDVEVLSGSAMTALGLSAGMTNESDNAFELTVRDVISTKILRLQSPRQVSYLTAGVTFEEGPKVVLDHRGMQRTSAKEMSASVDATGLYYVDVEIESLEPGDGSNLAADTALTVTGHKSLGYRLVSRNDALTFSPIEEVDIRFTPTIQDPEEDDGPDSYTVIEGSDLELTYEYDDQLSAVQNILVRDQDRVICNNPLAKSMLPAYVRTAITYSGGSTKALVMKKDIEDLINGTDPTVELETSQATALLRKRGATRVNGPIELLAVCHRVDRTIDTIRSRDKLAVGRTSKLIADVVNVTKG